MSMSMPWSLMGDSIWLYLASICHLGHLRLASLARSTYRVTRSARLLGHPPLSRVSSAAALPGHGRPKRVEHEYEEKGALALLVGLDIPHRPYPGTVTRP